MIFFDTETTGLLKPEITPLMQQPFITEFAAIKTDEDFKEIRSLTFFVKPPVPVPAEVTKITGITDAMLADALPFSAHYPELCRFFLGERALCAHNAAFDSGMLLLELRRLGKATKFPWPPEHVCTVERSKGLTNKYMKLQDLHKHYFGTDPEQKHRALDDVQLLLKVATRMRGEGFRRYR